MRQWTTFQMKGVSMYICNAFLWLYFVDHSHLIQSDWSDNAWVYIYFFQVYFFIIHFIVDGRMIWNYPAKKGVQEPWYSRKVCFMLNFVGFLILFEDWYIGGMAYSFAPLPPEEPPVFEEEKTLEELLGIGPPTRRNWLGHEVPIKEGQSALRHWLGW